MSSSFDDSTLADECDGLLVDLDGTVYRGSTAIAGAAEVLESIGTRALFLTNNASRSSEQVAEHMDALGFSISPEDVVTSAQTAARLLGERLPPCSKVLVIGTDALVAEIRGVGLDPVRSHEDGPVAVVQGHSPDTDWSALAEGALAIRAGAMWVACNDDATFPMERGLVPGNGAMVAALRAATGCRPLVAGKPAPHMVRDGLRRGRFEWPLLVGDRLQTDIAGAMAAGLPSLLVFSGVSSAVDLIDAPADCRPTYVAEDIGALTRPADSLRVAPQPGWRVDTGQHSITVTSVDDEGREGLSVVRAVADASWRMSWNGRRPALVAGDRHAKRALGEWGLLDE
ncbi:HAD-IIA family hydrolase [Mycolicibacterium moriokaense]|nr:HAD-IIA family hydrolase [Mycolicibacterium moriokaense]